MRKLAYRELKKLSNQKGKDDRRTLGTSGRKK
jgi:hypothetical protein